MKTPWAQLDKRHIGMGDIAMTIGTLNDTLDELLSLAKHLAPAIERIAHPEIQVDAGGIKPEDVSDWYESTIKAQKLLMEREKSQ